jgi:hypothetical protein
VPVVGRVADDLASIFGDADPPDRSPQSAGEEILP